MIASKRESVAIFTKRLGKYSETFIRQNIEQLNGGETVVVCRYLVDAGTAWLDSSRVLVLGKYPRFFWGPLIALFCFKHRVRFAVVEFLDWACDMEPYLRFLRLNYVALGHGFDVSRYIVSLEGYAKRLNQLTTASGILVPSEFLKAILLKATRFDPQLVHALPCGVDLSRFTFSEVYDRKRFVFIGRFVEKKAPLLLLKAFKHAVDAGADIYLSMGGDGPLLDDSRAYVNSAGLAGRVTFQGVLNSEAVLTEISSACAVVQHSITAENGDTEGLPVILQESLAVGTPVIATYHSGIPEIVQDQRHGYLVDEKDVEAMGRAFLQIVQMTDRDYMEMRRCCRLQAEACLSHERRVQWIQSLIDV